MASTSRTVAVFGAGYIGLVAGACFAELGHHVAVRECSPSASTAQLGDVPIYEPASES